MSTDQSQLTVLTSASTGLPLKGGDQNTLHARVRSVTWEAQDVLSLADIGVSAAEAGEAGSRTEVLALAAPPARGGAQKIEDDGNAAQAIVDFLAEKRLI